jgi:hypothetical protein
LLILETLNNGCGGEIWNISIDLTRRCIGVPLTASSSLPKCSKAVARRFSALTLIVSCSSWTAVLEELTRCGPASELRRSPEHTSHIREGRSSCNLQWLVWLELFLELAPLATYMLLDWRRRPHPFLWILQWLWYSYIFQFRFGLHDTARLDSQVKKLKMFNAPVDRFLEVFPGVQFVAAIFQCCAQRVPLGFRHCTQCTGLGNACVISSVPLRDPQTVAAKIADLDSPSR